MARSMTEAAGSMAKAAARRLLKVSAWIAAASIFAETVETYRFSKTIKLPNSFVLDVDLEGHGVVETSLPTLAEIIKPPRKYELRNLVEALDEAGRDERVKVLSVSMGMGSPKVGGVATTQDIRDAIRAFRQSASERGALAIAHAQTFGGLGNGTLGYYLASACDEIWMMPHGRLSLYGFAAQQVFLKGFLQKYGIEPLFSRRRDYKNAANFLTEATEHILRQIYSQVTDDLSDARGLKIRRTWWVMCESPLDAQRCVDLGFVDKVLGGPEMGVQLSDMAREALRESVKESGRQGMELKEQFKKETGREHQGGLPDDWEEIVDKRVDALTVPKVGLARYIKAMRTKEAAERRREERWEAARSLRKQAAEAWEAVWKREGAEKKGKKEGEKGEALAMLLGRIDGGKAEAGDREEERGEKRKGGEERRGEAGEQWGEIEREGEGAEGKGEGEKGEKKDGVAKRNHKATVAYVTAAGPIYDGSKRDSRGAAESGGVYAEDFVKTLKSVANDDAVKVVLLRINSPGGSADASELISRHIRSMRDKGKRVVVSMGDAAASGGYYIAAHADRVFAQPGTLTGSIGVIAGKVNVGELLKRYSFTVDAIDTYGPNVRALSVVNGFTRAQRRLFERNIDSIYSLFKETVASGRGMPEWKVERLAQGRVWMGSDAVKNGLVDATGGVLEALRVARSMAAEAVGPGADPRTHVRVREYPPRKSPLQELMEEAEDVTGIERGERGERREERGEGNGSRGAMSGETEGEGTSRLGGALWAVGRALGVVAGVVSDVEDGEGFKMGLVGWAERGAAGLLGGLGRVAAAMGMHPFEKGEAHVLGDLKILGSPEMAALYAAWLSSGGAPPPSLHAWALLTGQPMTASMEAESLRKSFGGGPCC